MNAIEYLDLFAGSLFNVMFGIIIVKKVFKMNVRKEKMKVIMYMFLTTLLMTTINYYNKDIFKIVLTLPVLAAGIKFTFNTDFSKSFLYTMAITIYMFIGEIIVGNIISLLLYNYIYIFNDILGTCIGNLLVIILSVPFIYIKKWSTLFNIIVKKVNKKKSIIYVAVFLLFIGAFGYRNWHSTQNIILSLSNCLIFIIFFLIMFCLYRESKKSEKLSNEYNVLLKYLDKYEIELDEKRKIVHDFKNQLIVINGYADESNIKLKEYVSEIINDQKNLMPSSLIKGIDKLPKGIKGLVYYKLSQLDKSYIVEIDVKGNLDKFNGINPKTNKDILKIMGILIDNAIEAVYSLNDKYLNIIFWGNENKIRVNIINNYYGNVNQNEIMMSGYSTKGENRGYGLSLVNDIIKSNNKLNFQIENNNNLFIAILKINIK